MLNVKIQVGKKEINTKEEIKKGIKKLGAILKKTGEKIERAVSK